MMQPFAAGLCDALGDTGDGGDDAYRDAIEHFVGTVRVPVGTVGPLLVRGSGGVRAYHVPLATTEGTLIASYGRGARLISAAGGCTARVSSATVARAPGFVLRSIEESTRFASWIVRERDTFAAIAADTSHYARLVEVRPVVSANIVHVIFSFTTGEAAGQNMAHRHAGHRVAHPRDVADDALRGVRRGQSVE